MRVRRPLVTDRIAGIVLGTTVFILFPHSSMPEPSTAPAQSLAFIAPWRSFVLDPGPAGQILPVERAKSE
jgi:hypothetical protein